MNERLSLEAGFRLDHVRGCGLFPLPRVSALYRFNERLSSRVGFGFGYRAPSVFTEESETLLFRGVLPVGDALKAERSRGATFDVNYRGARGEKFSYSLNQMFFYTEIENPLVLAAASGGLFRFVNAARPVTSAGVEAYYTGSQTLTDRFRTRPFRVFGAFGEKTFGKYSLFVNAENFTDTRQSRFTTVVRPPHQDPTFAEIYTHTEGRVFNGGLKVKF